MPLVSTQDEILKAFPKFSEDQIDFFHKLIEFNQSARLALDPGATDPVKYNLQYISLKAKEEELAWLINTTRAIQLAEDNERIHGKEYNVEAARAELDSAQLDNADIMQLL